MTDRFRFSSTFGRKLEELGVSPAEVLRHAGLPPGLLAQDKILITTEEMFALCRGLAEASGDPAIALKLGTEHRMERYDPVGLAALSARTFRDALQRLGRYKQLTVPEELRVVERGAESRVQFRWLLAEETEPALLVDLCFSWIVAIARRGTADRIRPLRVERRVGAGGRKMYEAHFGCTVVLGARQNALIFAKADLDQPFITHNADLFAVIAPQLEAELLEAQSSRDLGDRVKGILKGLLAGRRPIIGEVAKELRLSPRTLQRRLAEEGLSFQQLMQDARRELARHYLLNSSIELNETAYLLGYEDAHSFFRAFQDWEGSSPGEWRARQLRAGRARAGAASSSRN
jgi:AraC-like DNA-binding protein